MKFHNQAAMCRSLQKGSLGGICRNFAQDIPESPTILTFTFFLSFKSFGVLLENFVEESSAAPQ